MSREVTSPALTVDGGDPISDESGEFQTLRQIYPVQMVGGAQAEGVERSFATRPSGPFLIPLWNANCVGDPAAVSGRARALLNSTGNVRTVDREEAVVFLGHRCGGLFTRLLRVNGATVVDAVERQGLRSTRSYARPGCAVSGMGGRSCRLWDLRGVMWPRRIRTACSATACALIENHRERRGLCPQGKRRHRDAASYMARRRYYRPGPMSSRFWIFQSGVTSSISAGASTSGRLARFSNSVTARIEVVPLPGALPLMAGGVLMLAWAARRRRCEAR
jgi:hypothetical protein